MAGVLPSKSTLYFGLGLSFFGLVTILLLTLAPPNVAEDSPWRKTFTGSIFALICISGTVATFFPAKCSEGFSPQDGEKTTIHTKGQLANRVIKGHHIDCGEFSNHTVQVGNNILCAACTGLFIGATIALFGSVLYFFGGWQCGHDSVLSILTGSAFAVLGFVQFKAAGVVRSVLNALFVLGSYLIITGMDMHLESMLIDLYVIGLISIWILTRILLSQWDHYRICRACKLDCGLRKNRD
jgi:hypothetical protein